MPSTDKPETQTKMETEGNTRRGQEGNLTQQWKEKGEGGKLRLHNGVANGIRSSPASRYDENMRQE